MAVTYTIKYKDAGADDTGSDAVTVFADSLWRLFNNAAGAREIESITVVAPAGNTFDLTILPRSGTTRTLTQAVGTCDVVQTNSGAIQWSPVTVGLKTGPKIVLSPPDLAAQRVSWKFAGFNINIGGRPPVSIGQS